MLRNLIVLFTIYYMFKCLKPTSKKYKAEYIILLAILFFYFIGNFAFFCMQFMSKNNSIYPFFNLILSGGWNLWREQIVTPIVAILFFVYITCKLIM
jgi:O-antigen ligase